MDLRIRTPDACVSLVNICLIFQRGMLLCHNVGSGSLGNGQRKYNEILTKDVPLDFKRRLQKIIMLQKRAGMQR